MDTPEEQEFDSPSQILQIREQCPHCGQHTRGYDVVDSSTLVRHYYVKGRARCYNPKCPSLTGGVT